jgi:ATP-dependent DNA helicase RecG
VEPDGARVRKRAARAIAIDESLTVLPGVGPRRAERLAALGLNTVGDLLRHVPRAYEDRGRAVSIADARHRPAGSFAVVRGHIAQRSLRRWGRQGGTLRIVLEDATGTIEVLWFRSSFLAADLEPGRELAVSGRLTEGGALAHPEFSLLASSEEPVPERLEGIRPVYPLTEGLTQRFLREIAARALASGAAPVDPLPAELREDAGVAELAQALRWAHRPRSRGQALAGQDRLLFDELLAIELGVRRRLRARLRHDAPGTRGRGGAGAAMPESLPFTLTATQRQTVAEILADLDRPHPMGRLLTGDVGSGKTVCALVAVAEARSRGWQSAFLAPTDVLARQHFRTACDLLPGGAEGVALLTASLPAADVRAARRRVARGETDLVIGTHALLSESTRFQRLGLVIIDEQQRFGVRQREALLAKAATPHTLTLTATPIPRTLALLAFGDLDLSVLEPRQGGRGPVTTRVVSWGERQAALSSVREQLEQGEQAFFVRPRIEGEAEGALELGEELGAGPLSGVTIDVVHGRLPAELRDERLERFRRGETRALVATTLVEVGLDVPGASILWVEGAEKLGLAQLHQLRGRIARRGQKGYCWVITSDGASVGARERLATLAEVDDGFRLAEIDLALRGPGELLGLKQSGRVGLLSGAGFGDSRRWTALAARAGEVADRLLDMEERSPEGGCRWIEAFAECSSSRC